MKAQVNQYVGDAAFTVSSSDIEPDMDGKELQSLGREQLNSSAAQEFLTDGASPKEESSTAAEDSLASKAEIGLHDGSSRQQEAQSSSLHVTDNPDNGKSVRAAEQQVEAGAAGDAGVLLNDTSPPPPVSEASREFSLESLSSVPSDYSRQTSMGSTYEGSIAPVKKKKKKRVGGIMFAETIVQEQLIKEDKEEMEQRRAHWKEIQVSSTRTHDDKNLTLLPARILHNSLSFLSSFCASK